MEVGATRQWYKLPGGGYTQRRGWTHVKSGCHAKE